jgi:tetratricopeptide (TPR) repeat protein
MDATGYRATNILLHAANAVAVFALASAFLARVRPETGPWRLWAAAIGALFFAAHPLRVESAVWITERRDVLSGLFAILAVFAYLRAAEPGPRARAWYAASLAFFALSLLSKAWAITLPAVLLALDVWPLRRLSKRALLEKIPFVALAAPVAVIAAHAVASAMPSLEKHSPAERALQAAYGLVFYPWKTAAPAGLSPLYLRDPSPALFSLKYGLPILLLAGAGAALVVFRRRVPGVALAAVCYAVTVSPVLGLVQAGPQQVADRYAYLTCLPFALLVAAGVERALAWRPKPAMAAAGAALAFLAGLTAVQIGAWKTPETFWKRVLEIEPENPIGRLGIAIDLHERGELQAALAATDEAIRLSPRDGRAWTRRGRILHDLGRLEEAEKAHDRAIRLEPEYSRMWSRRGIVRLGRGNIQGAMADFDEALRLDPEFAGAHAYRGDARRALRDAAGARADYDEALRVEPDYAGAWLRRGRLRLAQGDKAGGAADIDRAATLEPANAEARFARGSLRQQAGDLLGALDDFTAAVRAAPRHAEAWANRGNVRRQVGDVEGALEDYGRALELNPRLVEALASRGTLLLGRGDRAGGTADLERALEAAPADWPPRSRLRELLENARRP